VFNPWCVDLHGAPLCASRTCASTRLSRRFRGKRTTRGSKAAGYPPRTIDRAPQAYRGELSCFVALNGTKMQFRLDYNTVIRQGARELPSYDA